MPSNKLFSIVCVTDDGDQMTSSGFREYSQVVKHLNERLSSPTRFVSFVIVRTINKSQGNPATVVQHIDREDALRLVQTHPATIQGK